MTVATELRELRPLRGTWQCLGEGGKVPHVSSWWNAGTCVTSFLEPEHAGCPCLHWHLSISHHGMRVSEQRAREVLEDFGMVATERLQRGGKWVERHFWACPVHAGGGG